jgi:hypothetical protein
LKSWKEKQRARSTAYVILFFLGPALYIAMIEWPQHQALDYDRFSGYSLFSNVVPFSDCKSLLNSAPATISQEAFQEICTDNAVQMESPQQLWNSDSFLGRAQEDLFAGVSRSEANHLLAQWSRNLVLSHPEVLAKATARNLGFYFTSTRQDSLSYREPSSWALAEKPIQDFFGESLESYKAEAQRFLDEKASATEFTDQRTQWMNILLRWVGSLGIVIIFAKAVQQRKMAPATMVAILAVIYGAAITIAGFYEPRAFIVLDMLLLLSIGLSKTQYQTYRE